MTTKSLSQTAISIRLARHDECALMAEWAATMAMESEGKVLDHDTVLAGIRAGMADDQRAIYYMADIDGAPAGTLMVNREWSDWRNRWWWWLQSVYVPPMHRRKGVFQALYAHVQTQAKTSPDVCGIRLYVEHDNIGAQKTYAAMGMKDSGYQLLEEDFQAQQ